MMGGAIWLFSIHEQFALLVVGGIILMAGYLVGTTALGAEIRDLTPKGEVGAYQSVRMVFVVMLPMIIGSSLSSAVNPNEFQLNDYGQKEKPPHFNMFLVTAIACVLTLAPIIILLIQKKKAAQQAAQSKQ